MDEQGEGPAEQEGTHLTPTEMPTAASARPRCRLATRRPAANARCSAALRAASPPAAVDVTLCRACAMPVEGEAADATARAEAGTRGEVVEVAATVAEWA